MFLKVHAIEDHLCDQILQFGGIGDLGEDFMEQSHQDGIKDQKRLKIHESRRWLQSGNLDRSL